MKDKSKLNKNDYLFIFIAPLIGFIIAGILGIIVHKTTKIGNDELVSKQNFNEAFPFHMFLCYCMLVLFLLIRTKINKRKS